MGEGDVFFVERICLLLRGQKNLISLYQHYVSIVAPEILHPAFCLKQVGFHGLGLPLIQ